MGMRVERDPLGSILLLSCLQLSEHFTVSADLLTLKLLGVRDVGEKFADVIKLPAESVDIVAEVRTVVIMSLVFDGLDDRADLTDPAVEVLELSVDLTLHDLQVRDHDADAHH